MDEFGIWAVLLMAFGLGMVHALDADHIIAVSALGAKSNSWRNSLRFCLRWALGHGGALLVIGAAVLFLGMAIPERLSRWAETAVGLVLILVGAWVIHDLVRRRAHVHVHTHDNLPDHAHWHTHTAPESHPVDQHRHDHAPVMVGLLHGTAGSAPLLAILPLTQMASPWLGFFYLVLFGAGVFLAMLVFGGVLGGLIQLMHHWGQRFVMLMRLLAGLIAMGFGVHLFYLALS